MKLRFMIAVSVAALVISGCGGSDSEDSSSVSLPSTDAEWGVEAKPVANRLENTIDQLADQFFTGEGFPAIQEKCLAVADAARDGLSLPPIPSGGDAQEYFESGLQTIIDASESCASEDADNLVEAMDNLATGVKEITANVGAFELEVETERLS